MILTVTPNPSIDLLYETDSALVWDDANRVEMPRRRAGGQGINLTRAARALGGDSEAVAFFGGSAGAELKALLDADHVPHHDVAINADTRVFVAVRDHARARSMLINPRGPVLTEDDRAHLLETVEALCKSKTPEWVVCSGSIPRGIGDDIYGYLARVARRHGCSFVADCDGSALEQAVKQGCDLIAPNRHEAERLLHQPMLSPQDAGAAAKSLLSAAASVLIKLGHQGAVLANAHGLWHAQGPAIRTGSSVGAGDAFLAAYLTAQMKKAPPYEALREAVAAGTAVLLSQGSDLIKRSDYDVVLADVVVTPL